MLCFVTLLQKLKNPVTGKTKAVYAVVFKIIQPPDVFPLTSVANQSRVYNWAGYFEEKS